MQLSIIVICFNMARELPRTIKSLSTKMQNDIESSDYEIIIVDNGSTTPYSKSECRKYADNIRFVDLPKGNPSPCKGINEGLAIANGNLIGVFIDGARMASPGLLQLAITASKLSPRSVIGTLSFHLGSSPQNEAMLKGYNQEVEDRLLESIPWEENGYELFNISTFAHSSKQGWKVTPAETNALFMPKECWLELGGYDERFNLSGGGLANLDTWKRAIELERSELILLQGEATFHQFHGGVSTNSSTDKWQVFSSNYRELKGVDYCVPTRKALCFDNKKI